MLTNKQLETLPDHRLKEYLKKVRKEFYLAQHYYENGDSTIEFVKEAEGHLARVKAECAKRPHFGN